MLEDRLMDGGPPALCLEDSVIKSASYGREEAELTAAN